MVSSTDTVLRGPGRGDVEALLNEVLEARPASADPTERRSAQGELDQSCLVLDIRPLRLTSDKRRHVSVLKAPLPVQGDFMLGALVGTSFGVCTSGGSSKAFEQVVSLSISEAFGSSDRIWLSCSCGRRTMRLFLPADEPSFACNSCHRISVAHTAGLRLNRGCESLFPWRLNWTALW